MLNLFRKLLTRIYSYLLRVLFYGFIKVLTLLQGVHSYPLWRLVYGTLGAHWFFAGVAKLLQMAEQTTSPAFTERVLNQFSSACVYSGWPVMPKGTTGWINLHASQFVWNVRLELVKDKWIPSKKPILRNKKPLSIGCFGAFSALLCFPKELFEAFPSTAQLFIFDKPFQGHFAEYLEPLTAQYMAVDFDRRGSFREYGQLHEIATSINKAELDIFLNISGNYDLIQMIDTPCIVNICMGSDLMHHDKVSFQVYAQQEPDYFAKDNRVFCGTTRSFLKEQLVYPGLIYYDPRGIEIASQPRWSGRDPMIVFHGSLYKLASSPGVLNCIFGLMQEDANLKFVFMGKDNGKALEYILDLAKTKRIVHNVHYEGEFSAIRNHEGEIDDPGWRKMLAYLQRARLAPNPWPMGGGCAHFECFAMGVPSVHMGLRYDQTMWGRPQNTVAEISNLLVQLGTATTEKEYFELCHRCLYDEQFANRLIMDQWEAARRVSNPEAYWQGILDCYQDWLERYANAK
jgi:hypothetical protein